MTSEARQVFAITSNNVLYAVITDKTLAERWEAANWFYAAHAFTLDSPEDVAKIIAYMNREEERRPERSLPCGNCGVWRTVRDGYLLKCTYCGDDESSLEAELTPWEAAEREGKENE